MRANKRKLRPFVPVPPREERERIINSDIKEKFSRGTPELSLRELNGSVRDFEELIKEFHERQSKAAARGARIPLGEWKEVLKQLGYLRKMVEYRVAMVEEDRQGTWVLWIPGERFRGQCKLFAMESELCQDLERYKHTEEQPKIEFARRVLVLDEDET